MNSSSATSVKSSRLVDAFENLPYLGICVDNSQVEMNLYFIVCTKNCICTQYLYLKSNSNFRSLWRPFLHNFHLNSKYMGGGQHMKYIFIMFRRSQSELHHMGHSKRQCLSFSRRAILIGDSVHTPFLCFIKRRVSKI